MAIAILRATDDGNGLAPVDLALIELAVNRRLDSSSLVRFAELHENATRPSGYTAPWLFGIEHLTIDRHRHILWKGIAVEHFDHAVWRRPGWRERMRADAEAVAARCRELEAAGIQPSMAALIDS
jgi:hypothetical protein